jgi:hypothetical protein
MTSAERMVEQHKTARKFLLIYWHSNRFGSDSPLISFSHAVEHLAMELDNQFLAGKIEAQEDEMLRRAGGND